MCRACSPRCIRQQPVWDWIAALQPDRLLLLGDSTYFHIDSASHPRDMPDWAFAQHIYQRYAELIAQPQFAGLVGAMPAGTVDAIWDDLRRRAACSIAIGWSFSRTIFRQTWLP